MFCLGRTIREIRRDLLWRPWVSSSSMLWQREGDWEARWWLYSVWKYCVRHRQLLANHQRPRCLHSVSSTTEGTLSLKDKVRYSIGLCGSRWGHALCAWSQETTYLQYHYGNCHPELSMIQIAMIAIRFMAIFSSIKQFKGLSWSQAVLYTFRVAWERGRNTAENDLHVPTIGTLRNPTSLHQSQSGSWRIKWVLCILHPKMERSLCMTKPASTRKIFLHVSIKPSAIRLAFSFSFSFFSFFFVRLAWPENYTRVARVL